MLYPPIKRSYVPESKKTKDLANLMNINSKFTGSGGSKHRTIKIPPHLLRKKHYRCPNLQFPGSSRPTSRDFH